MQEERQTTKEEGSKEEDRQGADVKKMLRIITHFYISSFLPVLFFASFFICSFCLSSSLLPSSFIVYLVEVVPKENTFCQKHSCIIVSLFFVVLVSTFPPPPPPPPPGSILFCQLQQRLFIHSSKKKVSEAYDVCSMFCHHSTFGHQGDGCTFCHPL